MRQDALARRNEPDAQPAVSDYDALCAALSANARGRAFLDEHARRARQADTALAIETLERLAALLRQRDEDADARTRLRSDLRALSLAITSARANFDRFEGTLAKRETVMALFDMLELRVTEMLADAPAEIEPPANENEILAAAAAAQVPAPVLAKPPAFVQPAIVDQQRRLAEPAEPTPQPKTAIEAETFPADVFAPAWPKPVPAPPRAQGDILALIEALTPAEKIALFS